MKFLVIAPLLALVPATAGHSQATAAVAAPAAGKGQVVFFRKGGLMGAAISCAIHEHGAKISSLPPGKFAAIDATPGDHDYSVSSEATDHLYVKVAPGQVTYAKCTVGMGVMAGHPHLTVVDSGEFQKLQAKLKPAKPME